MIERLDYVKGLGTTAIWLTPSFKNKPVQGLLTPFPSDAYHGYWITDFTQIDPHLGTNQDLRDLIAGAHRRGMKSSSTSSPTTPRTSSTTARQPASASYPAVPTPAGGWRF